MRLTKRHSVGNTSCVDNVYRLFISAQTISQVRKYGRILLHCLKHARIELKYLNIYISISIHRFVFHLFQIDHTQEC